jgi:hypothetical protein
MMNTEVKYPQVRVSLAGAEGNVFKILELVRKAMKKAKLPAEAYEHFRLEATRADYDHLIDTVTQWVTTE